MRALLLSDLNSKIPGSIEPNGVQSILSGSGSNFGEIQYIKEDYQLDSDFEIFTSGSGGIFRSGIPIGKTNDFAYIHIWIEILPELPSFPFGVGVSVVGLGLDY